jgi:hypothetical protein
MNQSTQRCQSLITLGSDHPQVLEQHMVLMLLEHMIDLDFWLSELYGGVMATIQ